MNSIKLGWSCQSYYCNIHNKSGFKLTYFISVFWSTHYQHTDDIKQIGNEKKNNMECNVIWIKITEKYLEFIVFGMLINLANSPVL